MKTMDKVQTHIFWVIIVLIILTSWIILITVVMLMVKPRTLEGSPEARLRHKEYPAVINSCPKHSHFLYYMNFTKCSSLVEIARNECPSDIVCMPRCPGMTYVPQFWDQHEMNIERDQWSINRNYVVCVKSLSDNILTEPPSSFDEYVANIHKGLCADKVFRSNSFFNKICLPTEFDEPEIVHLGPRAEEEDTHDRISASIELKRRSHEMFFIWVAASAIVTTVSIFTYLLLFLYFIKFTVYFSLLAYFLLLIAALTYSITMIVISALRGDAQFDRDPDWTLGLRWIYWLIIAVFLIFLCYLFCDFIRKCFYSIPKAIQFLLYVNKGIGGLRSAMLFIFLGILVEVSLIFCFIQLIIIIYESGVKLRRLNDLSFDCICINGYTEGVDCNVDDFKDWCHDRISGGPCIDGSCDLYGIYLNSYEIFLILALCLTTYYLLWFVKGAVDMIIGTTFVFWYRDNFNSSIPFKQFAIKTIYCLKYQSGTLAIGSLVMFCIGLFHVLFQFIEHLVLFTIEIKKIRRKRTLVAILERLSRVTSTLTYIEASVNNTSFCQASRRIDIAMAAKVKNIRLINRLVDMVLFICALLVVVVTSTGMLLIYAYPHTFIEKTASRDIFTIMASPIFILAVFVVSTYFLIANILSLYSISVNAIFLCYVSDIPTEISRKRKYRSSKVISEDMDPDKYDVLGKLNELGETPGDKNIDVASTRSRQQK